LGVLESTLRRGAFIQWEACVVCISEMRSSNPRGLSSLSINLFIGLGGSASGPHRSWHRPEGGESSVSAREEITIVAPGCFYTCGRHVPTAIELPAWGMAV